MGVGQRRRRQRNLGEIIWPSSLALEPRDFEESGGRMRRLYHSRRTNEDVRRAIVGQNFSEKKRRCSTECSGSRSGGGGLRGIIMVGMLSGDKEVFQTSRWSS